MIWLRVSEAAGRHLLPGLSLREGGGVGVSAWHSRGRLGTASSPSLFFLRQRPHLLTASPAPSQCGSPTGSSLFPTFCSRTALCKSRLDSKWGRPGKVITPHAGVRIGACCQEAVTGRAGRCGTCLGLSTAKGCEQLGQHTAVTAETNQPKNPDCMRGGGGDTLEDSLTLEASAGTKMLQARGRWKARNVGSTRLHQHGSAG